MADGFLSDRFTIPPEQRNATTNTGDATTGDGSVQPTTDGVVPTTDTPPVAQPPVDEFFEKFNTRFGTQYKSDEEVKPIFEAQKKVSEYEVKLRDAEERAKKADEYQKQIDEIRSAGKTEFLSTPLVRKAYIAEQLLAKYPDKDPFTLQEIAMADVDKLDDLSVLIKKEKIDFPSFSEQDHRSSILKSLGVDPDSDPTEWESITKLQIAKAARAARQEIKSLTEGIELPKAVTKEERVKAEEEALQKRIAETSPLKEEFTKFDKYEDPRLGDLGAWDVSKEFQSKLPDMFQAMFVDAGMDVTPENKQALIELRNAMLVYEELPKIIELAKKAGATAVQSKIDAELHNSTPPNTTTATDHGGQDLTKRGLAAALNEW